MIDFISMISFILWEKKKKNMYSILLTIDKIKKSLLA